MDDPELYGRTRSCLSSKESKTVTSCTAEKIVCVAIADNAAETDDELMFLAGEEVTILQKLDDGIYFVRERCTNTHVISLYYRNHASG